ncbi:heterokaryon incompatibility protein-domain-containing protein [Tricladium varicosporioides]|nr:heterokaryon incompatibility protein-domain-containing protein [Hymenoscyphus varicosporioides]
MRLLSFDSNGALSLTDFYGNNIPEYAILSHTWGADSEEVTFNDVMNGLGKDKEGYKKIQFCGEQAERNRLQHFWVDTCCIDKSSGPELSEAINSMFRWYQKAEFCYVYLLDVSIQNSKEDGNYQSLFEAAFKKSRWFTRGWTLQELLAPRSVEFFDVNQKRLGDRESLEGLISEITGISLPALQGRNLSSFSIAQRISWGAKRKTKREEDKAYSLIGILDINMSLRYGEGWEGALARVKRKAKKIQNDGGEDLFPENSKECSIFLSSHIILMLIEIGLNGLMSGCMSWKEYKMKAFGATIEA